MRCRGQSAGAAREQARRAREAGCTALAVAPGIGAEGIDGGLELDALSKLTGFDAGALGSARDDLRAALREGVRKVVQWSDRHDGRLALFPDEAAFFNVNTPDDLVRAEAML